jgi:hypothetical protein
LVLAFASRFTHCKDQCMIQCAQPLALASGPWPPAVAARMGFGDEDATIAPFAWTRPSAKKMNHRRHGWPTQGDVNIFRAGNSPIESCAHSECMTTQSQDLHGAMTS